VISCGKDVNTRELIVEPSVGNVVGILVIVDLLVDDEPVELVTEGVDDDSAFGIVYAVVLGVKLERNPCVEDCTDIVFVLLTTVE